MRLLRNSSSGRQWNMCEIIDFLLAEKHFVFSHTSGNLKMSV